MKQIIKLYNGQEITRREALILLAKARGLQDETSQILETTSESVIEHYDKGVESNTLQILSAFEESYPFAEIVLFPGHTAVKVYGQGIRNVLFEHSETYSDYNLKFAEAQAKTKAEATVLLLVNLSSYLISEGFKKLIDDFKRNENHLNLTAEETTVEEIEEEHAINCIRDEKVREALKKILNLRGYLAPSDYLLTLEELNEVIAELPF